MYHGFVKNIRTSIILPPPWFEPTSCRVTVILVMSSCRGATDPSSSNSPLISQPAINLLVLRLIVTDGWNGNVDILNVVVIIENLLAGYECLVVVAFVGVLQVPIVRTIYYHHHWHVSVRWKCLVPVFH